MNFLIILANSTEEVTPGVITADISWASDLLALLSIVGIIATGVAFWIRHEVKKNLNEIKAEFKPNGGSSLKDQVNRLEERHDRIDEKVDNLDSKVDTIVNFILGKKNSE